MDGNDLYLKVELYTNSLYPGMMLKGNLFSDNGTLLFPANKQITKEFLKELAVKDIKKVYYSKPALTQDMENVMIPKELLEKAYTVSESIGYSIIRKTQLPEKEINETVEQFIEKVFVSEKGTMLNLVELQEHDEHTYFNSVNIALMSVLFGKLLGWSKEQIKNLGIGALLHDVGKLLVPNELLNKKEELSTDEFDIIKKHAILGYNILKSQTSYNDQVLKIVLMHHENWDGSGYPLGIKSDKIEDMPQIISLCDFYVASTSVKTYRDRFAKWKVFLMIRQNMGTKFNPRFALDFINKMPSYILDRAIFNNFDLVMLNTLEMAEVIKTHSTETLKPMIKIYTDSIGESLRFPIQVDLQLDDSRWIESVIEDKNILKYLKDIIANFK